MNLQAAIEANTSLPIAKKIGRREWQLVTPTLTLTLKNADAEAFEEGFREGSQT